MPFGRASVTGMAAGKRHSVQNQSGRPSILQQSLAGESEKTQGRASIFQSLTGGPMERVQTGGQPLSTGPQTPPAILKTSAKSSVTSVNTQASTWSKSSKRDFKHTPTGRRKSHAILIHHLQSADPSFHDSVGNDHVYGGEFIHDFLDEVDHEEEESPSFGHWLRARLAHLAMSQRFEMTVGAIIVSNFVVIAWETDAHAKKDNAAPGSEDHNSAEHALNVIAVLNLLYLFIYSVECFIRMYVLRRDYFKYAWNNFDMLCIVTGVVTEIVGAVSDQSGVEGTQGLRTLRIARMLRVSRVMISFDELYALISGLKNAMKTLTWAGGLMLMLLTMWSVLAVEFVQPLMPDIDAKGGFGTCTWCPKAFDSVLLANLTFFQMISGDGWSSFARPVIETHAWTGLLFVAVIFSMVFGFLNLIVAVMVDSAHMAREADILNMAAKKDAARAAAWDCFSDLVDELDHDDDGEISIEELRAGVLTNSDLAAYLTVMGIEEQDLEMVFELLDADSDGAVTHEEFTHSLYQMKTQELPIAVCWIRHGVLKLHKELEEVSKSIEEKLENMLSKSDHIANKVEQQAPNVKLGTKLAAFSALSAKQAKRVSIAHQQGNTETLGDLVKTGRGSLWACKTPPTLRPKMSNFIADPTNRTTKRKTNVKADMEQMMNGTGSDGSDFQEIKSQNTPIGPGTPAGGRNVDTFASVVAAATGQSPPSLSTAFQHGHSPSGLSTAFEHVPGANSVLEEVSDCDSEGSHLG